LEDVMKMSRHERKLATQREDRRRERVRRAYLASRPINVSPAWAPYGITIVVEVSSLREAIPEPPVSCVRLIKRRPKRNVRRPVDVFQRRFVIPKEDDDDTIVSRRRVSLRSNDTVVDHEKSVRYDGWRERDALRFALALDPSRVLDRSIFMAARGLVWQMSPSEAELAIREIGFCPTLDSFYDLRSRFWDDRMKKALISSLCAAIEKSFGECASSDMMACVETLWDLFRLRIRRQGALECIVRWIRQRWQVQDVDAWISAQSRPAPSRSKPALVAA
jgi:hypothetical protein